MALSPGFPRLYISLFVIAGVAYSIGQYITDIETLKMTTFRDKSALYGRELKPGESPTWP